MTVPIGFENHPGYVFDGASWVSFVGPEGKPGGGINYMGTVASTAALPATANSGDAYVVVDTNTPPTDPNNGKVFVWSKTSGKFMVGPWQGVQGPPGQTLTIAGAVATASALPPTPTNLSVYMATGKKEDPPGSGTWVADPGHLYFYEPTSPSAQKAPAGTGIYDTPVGYIDLGAIAGPPGPIGPQGPLGPGPHVIPAVQTEIQLPNPGNPGEMCLVNSTGHIWAWNANAGTPDPVTGIAPGAWEDGGKISTVGSPAKMLPSVADSGQMPWPGHDGEMILTNDDGHLYSWDQTKNGGVGDWTDVGVWNFRINTAGDFQPISNPTTGLGLVWNQALRKWYPGLPDTAIQPWDTTVDYQVGMLCTHAGSVFIALRPNLGTEPSSAAAHAGKYWKMLDASIRPWTPATDWEPGEMVWVPDVENFYKTGSMSAFGTFAPGAHGSLWVATASMSGSTPVGAGEPCSISDVPPGYSRFNTYNPPTNGHLSYNPDWQRVSGERTFFFPDSAAMVTEAAPTGGMLRYGDIGINLAGDLPMGQHIYKFDPGQPYHHLTGFWQRQPTDFAIKGVPDGVYDRDVLTWDATNSKWVTSEDSLGDETNVFIDTDDSITDDGTLVYDANSNSWEVRRYKVEDLGDVDGTIIPNKGDLLVWNGTKWTPKESEIPPHTVAESGRHLAVTATGDLDWETPPTGGGGGTSNLHYVVIGKAAYTALSSKNPDTLYLISGP